jgi:hypothetical protein
MSEYRNYGDDFIIESNNYGKHVSAMTGEQLHSKSDIAAELAYRDDRIEQLERENELATKEALLMVQAMHKDFYSDSDGAELFEPLDTTSGLLTQIDNMYAGIRNRCRELERDNRELADKNSILWNRYNEASTVTGKEWGLTKENQALAAHVERLIKACELARDNYGKMLLTDPPQEAWKANQVTTKLVDAIASTPRTSLAERDAEVANKALLKLAEYMEEGFGVPVTMGCDEVRDYAAKIRNEGSDQ